MEKMGGTGTGSPSENASYRIFAEGVAGQVCVSPSSATKAFAP